MSLTFQDVIHEPVQTRRNSEFRQQDFTSTDSRLNFRQDAYRDGYNYQRADYSTRYSDRAVLEPMQRGDGRAADRYLDRYADYESRYSDSYYAEAKPEEPGEQREINFFGSGDPIYSNCTHPLYREGVQDGYANDYQRDYSADYQRGGYANQPQADYSSVRERRMDYRYADEGYGGYDTRLDNMRREAEAQYSEAGANMLYDRLSYNAPRERSLRAVAPQRALGVNRAKSKSGRVKNVKGKIILAVYIAVIVLVATLIIVNATGINAGAVSVATGSGATSIRLDNIEASTNYAHSDYGYAVNSNWFDRLCDSLKS